MSIFVKTNIKIVASPMNYIGGKAKLLPQILPLFPDKINTFYDVFTGSGNISANITAKQIKANDLNHYVIQILEMFKNWDTNKILKHIDDLIGLYNLSKENKDGFLKLRQDYNKNPNPIALYTLVCYSFNYQFRFNNNHEYNNPFGANRSCFSDKLREKLICFTNKLKQQNISFHTNAFDDFLSTQEFKDDDFVYLDPPYLITTGSYNDGNRGFKDWTLKQENKLYEVLNTLDSNNVKWALSNVIEHKGLINQSLLDFSKNFTVHPLHNSYANSSYNTTRTQSIEVLVTNY